MDHSISIRPECLRPAASGWVKPTGPEIREIIQRAGFTQSEAARLLGVAVQPSGGARQIRKWIAEEHHIPYPAWALLCHAAGLGEIWINEPD